MRAITPDQTETTARGHEGARYLMSDYLGSHAAVRPGEQAYLVQQEAAELRAHFHEVDQFQVVLGGTGSIGRDRAGRGVVHYTDAYTAYGPIRTAPGADLSYLTLRRDPTTGINYMPEEREKRRRLAGRGEHFTVLLDDTVTLGAGPVELGRTARGAQAHGVRLGAGEALRTDTLPRGQAGYAVVLAGALRHGDRELPAGSLISFDDVAELAEQGGPVAGGEVAGPEVTGGAAHVAAEVAVVLFPPSA